MISLDDAIDLIPKSLIRKITSVELISESNNRAYKLLSDKREYFLRLDGPSAKHLGMDREKEVRMQKIAADAGFAPQILFEDYESGTFLTHRLFGGSWTLLGRFWPFWATSGTVLGGIWGGLGRSWGHFLVEFTCMRPTLRTNALFHSLQRGGLCAAHGIRPPLGRAVLDTRVLPNPPQILPNPA